MNLGHIIRRTLRRIDYTVKCMLHRRCAIAENTSIFTYLKFGRFLNSFSKSAQELKVKVSIPIRHINFSLIELIKSHIIKLINL